MAVIKPRAGSTEQQDWQHSNDTWAGPRASSSLETKRTRMNNLHQRSDHPFCLSALSLHVSVMLSAELHTPVHCARVSTDSHFMSLYSWDSCHFKDEFYHFHIGTVYSITMTFLIMLLPPSNKILFKQNKSFPLTSKHRGLLFPRRKCIHKLLSICFQNYCGTATTLSD